MTSDREILAQRLEDNLQAYQNVNRPVIKELLTDALAALRLPAAPEREELARRRGLWRLT